jgi:hypothetical protein
MAYDISVSLFVKNVLATDYVSSVVKSNLEKLDFSSTNIQLKSQLAF